MDSLDVQLMGGNRETSKLKHVQESKFYHNHVHDIKCLEVRQLSH